MLPVGQDGYNNVMFTGPGLKEIGHFDLLSFSIKTFA